MNNKGNIPVLTAEGDTLPEAWEKAVLKTWEKGIEVRTEYDRDGDPPSRDCTMIMVVNEPFKEPRIHRAFPAGLEELEIYRQEVINGIHDDWIKPEEGKWTYTYHQRLFAFEMEKKVVNQIDYIVRKLSSRPYSRRAQAVTWNVSADPQTDDPPCLQRVWCRLLKNGGKYTLNMNTHWRSRDIYKAAFMNIFALTDLQKSVAKELSKNLSAEVLVGRYVDITDSAHIYGSYFNQFKGFLETVKQRPFEERTWPTEFAMPFFKEAEEKIKGEKNG